jgi:hypothetical protein
MKVVYIEALLMDDGELIHFGKTLGRIGQRQRQLVESGATKLTKGGKDIVRIRTADEPDAAA